ncbi:MAG TPA: tetratricopeptide repeat protein, partial [Bryobacteraceae bacterium]
MYRVARWLSFALLIATLKGQAPPAGCAMDRAVQLHQAGQFPAAIREYQQCIAAEPDRAEARSNLGAILANLGRYQEAIDQYRAALKVAPAAIAPRLHFNLALAYYKSFQIPEAASELESLHRAQPADLNIALLLADCRLRTGDFTQAIDLLTPFESSQPGQSALDYVLGMALIREGRVAEGQLRVDRILGRGESAEGHFLLGAALFTSENFPAAVKELSKAAALNPDLPSLQSYYGRALLFTGDADAAEAAFRKELAANPNDFDANLQLASILAHRGKPDEARPLLEKAVQVRPGSAEARDALANGFRTAPPAATDPGIATGSPAPAIGALDLSHLPKPTVLVFGSYTCPKLRSAAPGLKNLAERYRGQVDFRLVYIREAHAEGGPEAQWQSTINQKEGISLSPARTLAEKQDHANLCLRKLDLPFSAVIDGLDGAAEKAYHAWPSRVYLVGADGRVAYNSRLGELDFRPAELDRAIREILAKRGAKREPD